MTAGHLTKMFCKLIWDVITVEEWWLCYYELRRFRKSFLTKFDLFEILFFYISLIYPASRLYHQLSVELHENNKFHNGCFL